MSVVIQLIAEYSPWIYALCGLIALWYVREAFLVRRERRQAMYTLEREAAGNRVRQMFGIAFGLVVVMGVVYYIGNYLAVMVPTPTIEEEVQTLTPESPLLVDTPTPSPEPATPTPAVTATPRPRPTARPTEIPMPTEPLVSPPVCPDPRCTLTSPGLNQVVQGAVQIIGSANHEQFDYYKLEFGTGPAPSEWNFILQGDSPVTGGLLGTWNVSGLAAGVYTLQLKVVNITGNWIDPPCQVQVTVQQ